MSATAAWVFKLADVETTWHGHKYKASIKRRTISSCRTEPCSFVTLSGKNQAEATEVPFPRRSHRSIRQFAEPLTVGSSPPLSNYPA